MEEQTIPDTQDEVVDTEQVAAEVNEQPAPNVVKDDVDVFAWANNLLQFKEDLKIELFLISKTYVLYRVNMDNALKIS